MSRWILVSLALVAPQLARAEDAAATARSRISAANLSPEQQGALLAPLGRAGEAHLPEGPVAAKILEGLAKGVPPERISAAAESVVGRLADGQAALDAAQSHPADRDAALVALALAEPRLGSREALLEVAGHASHASPEALLAAVAACGELKEAGVAVHDAAPVVGGLAAHGFRPEQIASVPRLLQQFRAEGGQDTAAFLEELHRRAEDGARLDDVVDPFGKGGDVLRHAPGHDAIPGSREDRGHGGRVLGESTEHSGSTPAVNDDLAARTGNGNLGQPPNGNNKGGNGKGNDGKGKSSGGLGHHGDDPGEP